MEWRSSMPWLQASFCWSHYVTSKTSSMLTFSRTRSLYFVLSIFPIIPSACSTHWIHSLHREPMVLGLFLQENAQVWHCGNSTDLPWIGCLFYPKEGKTKILLHPGPQWLNKIINSIINMYLKYQSIGAEMCDEISLCYWHSERTVVSVSKSVYF